MRKRERECTTQRRLNNEYVCEGWRKPTEEGRRSKSGGGQWMNEGTMPVQGAHKEEMDIWWHPCDTR